MEKIFVFLI